MAHNATSQGSFGSTTYLDTLAQASLRLQTANRRTTMPSDLRQAHPTGVTTAQNEGVPITTTAQHDNVTYSRQRQSKALP